MNNKQLAHRYVNGATSGTGSHFTISDDDLRSYGTVIARRFEMVVKEQPLSIIFMDDARFSTSTQWHQSLLRMAAHDHPAVRLFEVSLGRRGQSMSHTANNLAKMALDQLTESARKFSAELNNPKIKNDLAIRLLVGCGDTGRELKRLFQRLNVKPLVELTTLSELEEQVIREKIAANELKANEKKALKAKDYIADFRDGKSIHHSLRYLPVMLRVRGDTVVTSLGADVSLDAARTAYRIMKIGQMKDMKGYRIGGFTVISSSPESIKIGCHTIPMAEVELLAESQGWGNASLLELDKVTSP